jgi:hypothetical protein
MAEIFGLLSFSNFNNTKKHYCKKQIDCTKIAVYPQVFLSAGKVQAQGESGVILKVPPGDLGVILKDITTLPYFLL